MISTDLTIIISAISVSFALYFGIANSKRNFKRDTETEASQITTMIVKLENISSGIAEIKSEMNSIKNDSKENRERIIKSEESIKSFHRRLDLCEKHCKRIFDTEGGNI